MASAPTLRCALETSEVKNGFYARPTLIIDPPHDHPTACEEIFGPVACIFKWRDLDDVIRRANDTNFGLVANFWTQDLNKAMMATRKLEAGLVQINHNITVQANLPYGGFKDSGIGQEASLRAMLEHFTKTKTVVINQH